MLRLLSLSSVLASDQKSWIYLEADEIKLQGPQPAQALLKALHVEFAKFRFVVLKRTLKYELQTL